MKKILVALGALIIVGLGTSLVRVASSNDELRETGSEIRSDLERTEQALATATEELLAQDKLLLSTHRERRDLRRELRRRGWAVEKLRLRLKEIAPVESRFVPPGAKVTGFHNVPTGSGELAVVSWATGEYSDRDRAGLFVWSSAETEETSLGRLVRGTSWDLIYTIDIRPVKGHGATARVAAGPPASQVVQPSHADRAGLNEAGDVTGDGVPDLLTMEGNSGTGGCGRWRVLENEGSSVREIFSIEDCELSIAIKRGALRIDSAIYGKGCKSIHGCGRRRTSLRWNGVDFAEVRSRVIERY